MGVLRSLRRMKPTAQSNIEVLRRKIENDPAFAGKVVCLTKTGKEKMSDIIINFAEPLMEKNPSVEVEKMLIVFAIGCWNATLLPDEYKKPFMEDILDAVSCEGPSMRDTYRIFLRMMMERKQKLFANNRRFVISWNFQELKDGFHLSIASADVSTVISSGVKSV